MGLTIIFILKKSRIRETKNLSPAADSSTTAKKLLSIFFIPFRRHRRRRRQKIKLFF